MSSALPSSSLLDERFSTVDDFPPKETVGLFAVLGIEPRGPCVHKASTLSPGYIPSSPRMHLTSRDNVAVTTWMGAGAYHGLKYRDRSYSLTIYPA